MSFSKCICICLLLLLPHPFLVSSDLLGDLTNWGGDQATGGLDSLDILNTIKTLIGDMAKNPFKLVEPTYEDKQFGDTLKACVMQFNTLLPIRDTVKQQFNIIIPNIPPFNLINFDKIEDQTFYILAKVLKKLKQPLTFACNEIIPAIISAIQKITSGAVNVFTRRRLLDMRHEASQTRERRRLYENSECTKESNGLCSAFAKETIDANGPYWLIIKIWDGFTGGNANEGSDANEVMIWKIVLVFMEQVLDIIDSTCAILLGMDFSPQGAFPGAAIMEAGCQAYKIMAYTSVRFLSFAIDSADFHDGNLQGIEITATHQNTEAIIHNQFKIMNILNGNNVSPLIEGNYAVTFSWSTLHAACIKQPTFGQEDGWCASSNGNAGDYLQVDLGAVYEISAVATRARGVCFGQSQYFQHNQWVRKYHVKYATTWGWIDYGDLVGNSDPTNVVTNELSKVILARFVRFYPITYNNHKSMRVEVYGKKWSGSQITPPIGNVFDNQPTDDTIVIKIGTRYLYAVCMVIIGLIL
eukprot:55710_1